jgi:hypothetical protein
LEFDYGKSPAFAARAAGSFIDSLRFAGMVGADNVVRKDGHGSSGASIEPEGGAAEDVVIEGKEGGAPADILDPPREENKPPGSPTTESSGAVVSLAITLDLSSHTAEEVVAILGALGLTRHG